MFASTTTLVKPAWQSGLLANGTNYFFSHLGFVLLFAFRASAVFYAVLAILFVSVPAKVFDVVVGSAMVWVVTGLHPFRAEAFECFQYDTVNQSVFSENFAGSVARYFVCGKLHKSPISDRNPAKSSIGSASDFYKTTPDRTIASGPIAWSVWDWHVAYCRLVFGHGSFLENGLCLKPVGVRGLSASPL